MMNFDTCTGLQTIQLCEYVVNRFRVPFRFHLGNRSWPHPLAVFSGALQIQDVLIGLCREVGIVTKSWARTQLTAFQIARM